MGLIFRRSKRLGKGVRLNYGTGGASVSARRGRVTVNSRGRLSIRILPGLTLRL